MLTKSMEEVLSEGEGVREIGSAESGAFGAGGRDLCRVMVLWREVYEWSEYESVPPQGITLSPPPPYSER